MEEPLLLNWMPRVVTMSALMRNVPPVKRVFVAVPPMAKSPPIWMSFTAERAGSPSAA